MHTQYLKNTYQLKSNAIEESITSLLIIIAVSCNITNVSQTISLRVNQCYQIKGEKEKKLIRSNFLKGICWINSKIEISMASLIFPLISILFMYPLSISFPILYQYYHVMSEIFPIMHMFYCIVRQFYVISRVLNFSQFLICKQ